MIDFNQPPPVKLPAATASADPSVEQRDLRGLPLAGLLAAVNHVLTQQTWSRQRLAAHQGKVVRLGIDAGFPFSALAPNLLTRIGEDGLLEAAQGGQADVTLWLKPSLDALFKGLRDGPVALSGHLRVEGDVLLAGLLGELAQHLRWDPEEDLSKVVGDVAAHRVSSTAQQASQTLRDSGARLQDQASQFLTVEQGLLLDRVTFEAHKAEIEALRRRIDELSRHDLSGRHKPNESQ